MPKPVAYYDIVVVGAGPSGSSAAIAASKEGASVLLLEEHKEIGFPVNCAEATSFEGLEDFFEPKESWIASRIDGGIFISPSKRSFIVHFPNAGYILNREIFDRDLALKAKDYGTEIMTEAKAESATSNGVNIRRKNEEIFIGSKVVIAADGVSSQVGRNVGLDTGLSKTDYWITYQYKIRVRDISKNYVELYIGSEFAPGGYLWVFPKGNESANVGLGISPLFMNKPPRSYLDRFIKWRFNSLEIERKSAGRVPSKFTTNLVKDNIALVGDAARLVDPLTGGGIYNAIISGKMAGEAAVRAIQEDDILLLKDYERQWLKKRGREFKIKSKLKEAYLKMSDKDIENFIYFLSKVFDNRTIHRFELLNVVKKGLIMSPSLWRFTRYLI